MYKILSDYVAILTIIFSNSFMENNLHNASIKNNIIYIILKPFLFFKNNNKYVGRWVQLIYGAH